MTEQHPITPPPELVEQWLAHAPNPLDRLGHVATQAARWGSDQELEACLQWFSEFYSMETWMQKDLEKFCTARRPKPLSLVEDALSELNLTADFNGAELSRTQVELIRAALERLQKLENND